MEESGVRAVVLSDGHPTENLFALNPPRVPGGEDPNLPKVEDLWIELILEILARQDVDGAFVRCGRWGRPLRHGRLVTLGLQIREHLLVRRDSVEEFHKGRVEQRTCKILRFDFEDFRAAGRPWGRVDAFLKREVVGAVPTLLSLPLAGGVHANHCS